MTTFAAKAELRRRFAEARRARSEAARIVARAQIATHLLDALTTLARERPVRVRQTSPLTVCIYLPLPSEPLPPRLAADLVDAGIRVLAPIATAGEPLDWCVVDRDGLPDDDGLPGASGAFVTGPFGLLEPTGPRLGPAAIRGADVVLTPALAVDSAGIRLGRGGGHYDRSLALMREADGPAAAPDPSGPHAPRRLRHGAEPENNVISVSDARVIAVLFDGEIVAELPREPHDVPVTDIVTPEFGLCHIPGQMPLNAPGRTPPNMTRRRDVAKIDEHGAKST